MIFLSKFLKYIKYFANMLLFYRFYLKINKYLSIIMNLLNYLFIIKFIAQSKIFKLVYTSFLNISC